MAPAGGDRSLDLHRIVSIDGGGIRGLFSSVLLDRLSRACPTLLDRTDLVAGTSSGGIIALALAHGVEPPDLVRLFRDNAALIFDDSFLDDLRDLGGLVGARYGSAGLLRVLRRVFGRARLGDLRTRVLVPAFHLDNRAPRRRRWKPKFFHNFPGPDSDAGERVVDVAMRSSAAPTYFPTYQGYIDGGIVANDPAMAAVAQALDPGTGGQRLEALRLLSVGSGQNPTYLPGDQLDWGVGQWARVLVRICIDGEMGVARYQCQRLLGPAYCRVDGVLPRSVPLDRIDHLDLLVAAARKVPLRSTHAWLRRHYPPEGGRNPAGSRG